MNWNGLELPDRNVYHVEDAAVIYCADCRDILPLLPKVDLVLTDPPYANGTVYDGHNDNTKELSNIIVSVMPFNSYRVAITPGIANMYHYPNPDWVLAWVQNIAGGMGAGSSKWGFNCWQPILVYGKDPYLQTGKGRRPDMFIRMETSSKNGHPCPKPIDVWRIILKRVSVKDTDIILDPFLGSGTTAVAAKHLGRKCIGIEISEKYCEIAKKRLAQSVMELGI